MKTDDIRIAYLEFFRSKAHEIVPSDSLVPKDDPSLLFTGAGMNQFKEKFMARNVTYKRAATSQKCLRTGDLENVGKTAGHHTFFEMLGNFSFGDYFKREAIIWGWEFLTAVLKISPEKLWVSVYKDDEEAYAIWRDVVKVPEHRIVKLSEKDNFWPSEAPTKGPNGPCGPCSEIFFDQGEKEGCGKPGCSPVCDCKRFVEVWNLVFTQFDRQSDGNLKPLPNKNIDTGMGLERITAVMQGVRTNFEIDIFKPVVDAIRKESKARIQDPKVNAIADHIRAVTFAISDGVMPSNEERGYVIRKLVRRSLVHAIDLGIKTPFLYKLVSAIVESMRSQYPELAERRDDIAQVVKREEENFMMVLDTQIPKVEEAFRKLSQDHDAAKAAQQAFDFYDTYGMPYDMLEEIAEKFGLKIDNAAFENLLDKQRARSRAKSKIKSEIFSETFARKVEALGLKTEFIGYDKTRAVALVLAVLEGGEVVLDRTPFYGESGGQAGDQGEIETPSGRLKVRDTKKIGSTIVHAGTLVKGRIEKGEEARALIDETVRRKIMSNHTATHLLHAALRRVLGEHVHQTGSLVDESHIRFDFTHMAKMEARELARVESLVNEDIKKHIRVNKEVKGLEAAKHDGATALFGEKYEDTVRVVTISDISKELCGGTHVDNTGDIGMFRITSESSIASGVRRIEALTGDEAAGWMARREEMEKEKIRLQNEKEDQKRAAQMRLALELAKVDDLVAKAKNIGKIKFICEIVDDAGIDILRALSDKIKMKSGPAAVILATKKDGKVAFVTSVTEDMVKNNILSANDMAKELATALGGSGGGKPDFAQGGSKDPSQLDSALNRIFEIVKGKIK